MTSFKKQFRNSSPKEYNFKQLYNYGVNRLYARDYSKKELFEKMKQYQNDLKIIDDVLSLLEKQGYLSDKHKAQSIIHYYSSKESLFKIKNRLKNLGISSDIIEELFSENENNYQELDTIVHLLEKKFHTYNEINYLKMVRFLAQKGFQYEEIKKAISLFKSNISKL